MAERTQTVIVGAGVCGLQAASRLSREGLGDFVLLEKQLSKGGVWSSFANKSSRVQISEVCYRPRAEQVLTDFTPQEEILSEMEEVCRRDDIHGKMRLGCDVISVRDLEGEGVEVRYRDASGLECRLLATEHVLLCTGGLQEPRLLQFSGEDTFRGDVILGIGSQIDRTALAGKHVAVLGMGAFAIENARTALLAGAKHVTIVARTLALVIPRMMMLTGTFGIGTSLYTNDGPARVQQPPGEAKSGGDAKAAKKRAAARKMREQQIMFLLSQPYRHASAEHLMPASVKSGDLGKFFAGKEGVRVPTCSDIFFLALKLGLVDVVHGEVDSFATDGLQVRENLGEDAQPGGALRHVPCDVAVKCFGFEAPDRHLAALVGREHIRSPLFITERVWLMKGERNPMVGRLVPSGSVNLSGSLYCISDLYMEIFMYFRERPEELRAIMERLPQTAIYEDNYECMVHGLRLVIDGVPVIAQRAKAVREGYGRRTAKWKRGMLDVLLGNKADWEEACAALAGGDRHAVSYPWEAMLGPMQALASAMGPGPGKAKL
mmetsp:Transcript_13724/g.39161  ORF Transcript_13724/g.39161 Transcript_13724/m.39161 type:complete len:547 (-) Transcript_13724:42-1682(-)